MSVGMDRFRDHAARCLQMSLLLDSATAELMTVHGDMQEALAETTAPLLFDAAASLATALAHLAKSSDKMSEFLGGK